MGNLCKLNTLDFTNNSISGTIEDLVDGLSKCRENKEGFASENSVGLETLRLGNNKLNGTVPETIGLLSKLSELRLSSNCLTGVLTESHFVNLANLTYLDLSYNSLQLNVSENWNPPFDCDKIILCSCKVGPVFPSWVRTQTQLEQLCLSDAGILGSIPAWFWNPTVSGSYFLNLSNNNLEGRLPTFLKNYSFFQVDLSSNRFEGPLPEFDPTSLQVIYLNNNSFSGSIPSYFGAATFIHIFSLSDNHINGSIPSFFCKIPDGLVSLTNLHSLHLRNNGFSGELPLALKKASKLLILDVGENKLSGSIPTWIGENLSSLIVLRLRSNLFEGVIPKQLSKLSSLQILDVAQNNLSGCIPRSFGDFKAMVVAKHSE
ncbi:receptor-like protein EIX2 [Dioscorea cayenensis subsp. rotundata]|uniref:Receptor-like protein EIX2 n=1 Tax=Dioscorea cayennensis subsp. rotundata TaxID=55577 RepID=A0AB40CAZ8_DIOCR|nr:receptor-like protein EIX2 [Dioscorea cayenensis subsp. rotundata]